MDMAPPEPPSGPPPVDACPPGLIQRYREKLQACRYARRTVDTYEQWLRRLLRFHQLRHPREMGSAEVNAFLTHLGVEGQVSVSTQNTIYPQLRHFQLFACHSRAALEGDTSPILKSL
jgi:site-specific recombinase XerD